MSPSRWRYHSYAWTIWIVQPTSITFSDSLVSTLTHPYQNNCILIDNLEQNCSKKIHYFQLCNTRVDFYGFSKILWMCPVDGQKDGVRDELHSNMLTLLRSLICALSSCWLGNSWIKQDLKNMGKTNYTRRFQKMLFFPFLPCGQRSAIDRQKEAIAVDCSISCSRTQGQGSETPCTILRAKNPKIRKIFGPP